MLGPGSRTRVEGPSRPRALPSFCAPGILRSGKHAGRPGRTRTGTIPFRKRAPSPLRRRAAPGDRTPPDRTVLRTAAHTSEIRGTSASARNRTRQPSFGGTAAHPLPEACAGMDSNHRCPKTTALRTAALPLCHRRVCPRGVEPRNTRVTAGPLSRLGQDTVLSKGIEPLFPRCERGALPLS